MSSQTPGPTLPVHVTRSSENAGEVAALARRYGGAVGLGRVLGRLDHQAERVSVPGRCVDWGFAWADRDQQSERWWPQGITTSPEALDRSDTVDGRRVLITSWSSAQIEGIGHGSRITVVDVDTLTYRHVLLVVPEPSFGELTFRPLHVHTGGLAWIGPYLHLAAGERGFMTCRLEDVIEVTPGPESFGHRFILPVRFSYDAAAEPGTQRMRFNLLSLDRDGPALLAGEYGGRGETTRLIRFPIDPDTHQLRVDEAGRSRPVPLGDGPEHMRGDVIVEGKHHVTVSRGPKRGGRLYVGDPGHLRPHRRALPPSPRDITWWPSMDRLWSLSDHPGKRWVFCLDRP